MGELQKLFNILSEEGLYTKSFDEFVVQYQDEEYQDRVFDVVSARGLYTKNVDSFKTKYSRQVVQPGAPVETEPINWFDQTWLGRGIAAASTTGEATDLLLEGPNVSIETIQDFIEAKEDEARAHVPSARMQAFQTQYQKDGSSWTAFFRGIKKDPVLMAELFVQSLGTQLGTAIDAPEARLAAVTGATLGAGATWYTGYGAAIGGIAGLMGGLATSMESALTFGELIEEELKKEGKEFTDVNIKALLEGPKGKSIRNRAIGRGLTIGTVEGLTGGIASKATTGVLKTGIRAAGRTKKVLATGVGVGVEAVGGGTGEVLGRAVAGQVMDPAEIGFEAITGTVTAPATVGHALWTHKDAVYTLNKEVVSYDKMKDFIETADDIDIAKADIKMENDITGLDAIANEKQQRAILDSQIDEKITDKKDREALLDLDAKRRQAKADLKKEGINQVPGAEKALADIESQISEIINKYEGAVDVAATQEAADVRKALRENKISDTIAFAEAAGKKIGIDVHITNDDISAQDMFKKIREEHNKRAEEHNKNNPDNKIKLIEDQDVTGADGFIVGDSIVINKDVAGRKGAINVGAHEILHGVLAKHLKSLVKTDKDGNIVDDSKLRTFIKDFKNTLTKEQREYVEKRLDEDYKEFIDKFGEDWKNTTDEWLTLFSDGITKGEITFNEGVFDKLKNTIQEILRTFGIKKEFENARQTYNFLKDYQKNVAKGELSARAIEVAGGGETVTEGKLSKTAAEAAAMAGGAVSYRGTRRALGKRGELIDDINDLQQGATTKADFQKPETFNPVFESLQSGGAINNYIRSLKMSPEKTQETIDAVTDRLINFDPAAKRKDGTVIGPRGLGEFIMANVGFGKLVAAKKLAVKGEKA